MGGQGDMLPLLFEVEGTPCVLSPSLLFGVDIFNSLITLQRLLLSKNVGMISVCQTSHCLCQDCVLWKSPQFNKQNLATCIVHWENQRMQKFELPPTCWGGGSLLPPQELHSTLSPSTLDPFPLLLSADQRPWSGLPPRPPFAPVLLITSVDPLVLCSSDVDF